jgi:hypothetical protein
MIMRQMMSGVPPAACETMTRSGRAGQLCANASVDAASNASGNASLRSTETMRASPAGGTSCMLTVFSGAETSREA